jgi:hypothetical protein
MSNRLFNILAAVAITSVGIGLSSCAPNCNQGHVYGPKKQVYKHEITSRTETIITQVERYAHNFTLTVRKGETLSGIAGRMNALVSNSDHPSTHDISWQDVYQQNKSTIKNPNMIYPGQTISYDTSKESSHKCGSSGKHSKH